MIVTTRNSIEGKKNSTDSKNSRGPTMACQLEFDSGGASAWMNGAGA
jgi:hypothetical protein